MTAIVRITSWQLRKRIYRTCLAIELAKVTGAWIHNNNSNSAVQYLAKTL
jgi:hypothetical protein